MNEPQPHIIQKSREAIHQRRPLGIIIVAVFTILAGLAEVVTGLTHDFFGITTSSVTIFT
jgi:hypothetical protein